MRSNEYMGYTTSQVEISPKLFKGFNKGMTSHGLHNIFKSWVYSQDVPSFLLTDFAIMRWQAWTRRTDAITPKKQGQTLLSVIMPSWPLAWPLLRVSSPCFRLLPNVTLDHMISFARCFGWPRRPSQKFRVFCEPKVSKGFFHTFPLVPFLPIKRYRSRSTMTSKLMANWWSTLSLSL